MNSSAVFSADRRYRYVLRRRWDFDKPWAMFIGLNPSTADETKDDPTIRRCIGFARDWGYGGLYMTNLFALRATDPQEMMKHPFPVGDDNDSYLLGYTVRAAVIIAAWGTKGGYLQRDKAVMGMIKDMKCLGQTKAGYPRHPLYLAKAILPRAIKEME